MMPVLRLGEVLRHRKEFVTIDDLQTYKRPRVRLHAQGIVLRDEVRGAEIKTKRQQVCRTGEFLVAEIDAKVGGFGILPPELDGAIVSSHYFLFVVDEHRLDRRFLDWFARTPAFREQVEAQGSTNYAAIRPRDVLEYQVPLPPLAEQRRIVARIEALAAKTAEIRTLRRRVEEEVVLLPHAVLGDIIASGLASGRWSMLALGDVADLNPAPTKKLPPTAEVTFVPMRAVSEVSGTVVAPERRRHAEVQQGYTRFEEGDVLFARITPCMQNGKAAIAERLVNGVGFGSTEFHVLRPRSGVMAEWLHQLLRHRSFIEDAAAHFTGTAGQQRVPARFMREKLIPVPRIEAQRSIVASLKRMSTVLHALQQERIETAAALDALLPSILDKAFKGEL